MDFHCTHAFMAITRKVTKWTPDYSDDKVTLTHAHTGHKEYITCGWRDWRKSLRIMGNQTNRSILITEATDKQPIQVVLRLFHETKPNLAGVNANQTWTTHDRHHIPASTISEVDTKHLCNTALLYKTYSHGRWQHNSHDKVHVTLTKIKGGIPHVRVDRVVISLS